VLNISPQTAAKISRRHGISELEVRQAIVCAEGLAYTWDEHPERGLRAIVEAPIRSRTALIVLYPTDDPLGDVYNLGSAYFG
jgi:hypothetical protein